MVRKYGTQRHRDDDKPAIICADGAQAWYVNNKLHREGNKPAAIYPNGEQEWYVNGERHRAGSFNSVYITVIMICLPLLIIMTCSISK